MSTRLLFILLLALGLPGCGGKKKEIVGQWRVEGAASESVWEFRANGAASNGAQAARYTLGDGNRLKIETGSAIFVQQMEINGDRMTWKAPNGARTELVRVK